MNKKEIREAFEKNVEYLRRNVPPDDIYLFSEQTLMAACFFLKKWSEKTDIIEEMLRDPIADKWIRNIVGFLDNQTSEVDIQLDLNLDSIED